MALADSKNIDGQTYFHEVNEYFTNREDAERHANALRREKYLARIQKRENGTYWVWWGRR